MLDQDSARHVVTAVVVTHDGARWLSETMTALRGQTRPLQRVVAADTGSTDDSVGILAEHLPSDSITEQPPETGYGDAVRAALDLPRSTTQVRGSGEGATEWIWLIHDDLAPEPDALEQLLAAADQDPRAAVLGPKLRDWFDRRLLVEVGVTIDGAGRRETGLEQREFDHGQHDGNRQVLAVSSAGMLVRRDVWDRLGGFDPSLPLFRDDIDFCWRVGGAGLRALVVTDAVAHHAEASSRRRREISATRNHPRRVDRRHAVFVLLANLPAGGMVAALLRNSFASLMRVVMYLLIKQPANALDEAAAITLLYLRPVKLVRARVRRRRDRRRTYSAIRPFLARGVAMRQFADALTAVLTGDTVRNTPGRHQAVTAPPNPDDEDEVLSDNQSFLRRVVSRHGVALVLGLSVISLIAGRSLLFGDLIAGGALPPVAGSAADLWSLYLSSNPDSGIGAGGPVPPYVGLLALLSTLTLGQPWLAVTVILLGCVPLAGGTAYLLAKEVLGYAPARLWLACTYALLPVATGAVAQGRLGTALVHALLPVLALLLVRVISLPKKASRRAAWGLGLILTVSTAFVPMLWLLSLVTGVLVAVAFGHVGRRLYVSVALSLALPVVLLLPWSLELILHPTLWLLEAGLHRPELSEPGAAPFGLLLLSPGGPGVPPVWVTGGFLAAALLALLLLRNRRVVAAGWLLALFGLLVAIVTSRLVVEPYFGGPPAPVWPGVALSFAATAVLMSAGTSARAIGDMLRGDHGGAREGLRWWSDWRRGFALAVTVLALATPATAAALWMWEGADGPVTAHAPETVPGALQSRSDDGTEPRALVVAPDSEGNVDYAVVRGREPHLGEEAVVPAGSDGPGGSSMDRAVAQLSAGQGGDQLHTLLDHGVQYVLYPSPEDSGPALATMVDVLDGTPGLDRQSLSDHYGLWRVSEETGALREVPEDGLNATALAVEGNAGNMTAEIGDGPTGRLLALAEPADGTWKATLDGAELSPAPTEHGTQAWELPVNGGRVQVWQTDHVHTAWILTQGLLLLVAVVLASPGVRTDEEARLIASTPQPRPHRPDRLRRSGRRGRGRRRTTDESTEDAAELAATVSEGRVEAGAAHGPEEENGDVGTGTDDEHARDTTTTTGSFPALRGGGRRKGTRRKPGRRRSGAWIRRGNDRSEGEE